MKYLVKDSGMWKWCEDALGRERTLHSKQDTHALWVEAKHVQELRSSDALDTESPIFLPQGFTYLTECQNQWI